MTTNKQFSKLLIFQILLISLQYENISSNKIKAEVLWDAGIRTAKFNEEKRITYLLELLRVSSLS